MRMHSTIRPAYAYAVILCCALGMLSLVYVDYKAGLPKEPAFTVDYTTIRLYSGAVLRTSEGDIEIEFLKEKAPQAVYNFVTLAQNKFFEGTKFHRVVRNFIIQGGDPYTKGDEVSLYGHGTPGYVFDDEITDEKMVRGVVAMANSGPDTNGSQFFILLATTAPWLQGQHTVFGKVVKGMDVADEISRAPATEELPQEPIVLYEVLLK